MAWTTGQRSKQKMKDEIKDEAHDEYIPHHVSPNIFQKCSWRDIGLNTFTTINTERAYKRNIIDEYLARYSVS
jgi:hypothetical protein